MTPGNSLKGISHVVSPSRRRSSGQKLVATSCDVTYSRYSDILLPLQSSPSAALNGFIGVAVLNRIDRGIQIQGLLKVCVGVVHIQRSGKGVHPWKGIRK